MVRPKTAGKKSRSAGGVSAADRASPRQIEATKSESEALASEAREPRGARRKRETRARLLDAALRLMAVKGMDGVSISEITEAADVGFGSFYNHFDSKEGIYAALIAVVFEDYAKTLDRLTQSVADPAEAFAICARHVLMRAGREPTWGHFLVREGLSMQSQGRGLSAHMRRDFERGLKAGRFKSEDPLVTLIAVGGTMLAAISAALTLSAGSTSERAQLVDFPERVATTLLRQLGLPPAQAEAIARRPLPANEEGTREARIER